jgi:hypothetical protein
MNDNPHHLARLHDMARAREVRAKLALSEASRLHQARARAEAELQDAHRRRTEHEEQAARVGAWVCDASAGADAQFSAEDAHNLLNYVVGARLRVQEDIASIRRAELACAKAQDVAEEAEAKFQRAAVRHEVILAQWSRRVRSARHKKLERAEEALAEERVNAEIVSRRISVAEALDDECNRNE